MKKNNMFNSSIFAFGFCIALHANAAEIQACKFKKPADGDIVGAQAVVARLKAECVPKISRVHTCAVRARLLMENVQDLTNIFLTSDKAKPLMVNAAVKGSFDSKAVDMSLWANFSAMEKDYQASLDTIDAFVTKFRDKTEKVGLRDFLAELDKGYNLNTTTLAELSLKESALLAYIDEAANALEASAEATKPEIQWLGSDPCKDADILPVLALSQDVIFKIVQRIDTIHAFIVRARTARQHLIQYSYESIRYDLATKYRNETIEKLGTLGGKIDAVLRADRVMVGFDQWTLNLLSDIERDSTETYYLQFEASQQINAVDLVTSQDFREQLLLVTESFPEIATPYLPRLNNITAGFEEKVARVEKLGWSGFLQKQKVVANRRLKTPEKYPPECVANLQAYLLQAQGVTTIEQYRALEPKYKIAIKSCQVKT